MRFNRLTSVGALLVAASLTMIPTAQAIQPAAPSAEPEFDVQKPVRSADEIIQRYVDAIGGEKAIRALKQRSIVGTMSVPSQGMTGELTVHAAAPDMMIMTVSLEGLGESVTGYTDGVAWSMDPFQGPMIQPDEVSRETERQANFYADLRLKDMYASITSMPQTTFEGSLADVLVLVDENDAKTTQYYDAETGLRIGSKSNQATQMGPMDIVTVYSDYKAFDGVKYPTKMVQRLGPMEMIMTTEKVTHAEKADPAMFEAPAAIKTLLEDRKKDAGG
jgi:zinc protease